MTSRVDEFDSEDPALRELFDLALNFVPDHGLVDVLHSISDLAGRILRCDYAAVVVLGLDGHREHFVPARNDSLAVNLIGRLPEHAPIIRSVMRDAQTVRLPDPRSSGDAAPELPVRALLGVPIMLRGHSCGGVYVAEPLGRDAFTDRDMRQVEAIAGVLGQVIEKSRTASANERREQWYAGGATLAREIVAGQHVDPLHRVVECVAEIAEADSVSILQHAAAEDTLVVAAAVGNGADTWAGSVLVVHDSITMQVMATGRPRYVERVLDSALPDARTILGVDSLIVVPLTGGSVQRGVLVIGRNAGRPRITLAEMGMATMFAGNVALALELSQSLTQRDQLALISERDRIARDLHDHVIQRLYAVGLSMQHAARGLAPEIEQRLTANVDEIDETIKEIRSTIYRLTLPITSSKTSLRGRAESILDDLEPVLGFRPRLVSDGPIDFGIDEHVVDDCTAVMREALTNVARHSGATEAEIALGVTAGQLRLEVRDNGRGLGETTRRSGLANLRARAEARGGFMQMRSSPADGTWLLWSIPVDSAE